jgi:hypothetical protein
VRRRRRARGSVSRGPRRCGSAAGRSAVLVREDAPAVDFLLEHAAITVAGLPDLGRAIGMYWSTPRLALAGTRVAHRAAMATKRKSTERPAWRGA